MTYNVLSGTLSLYTTTTTQETALWLTLYLPLVLPMSRRLCRPLVSLASSIVTHYSQSCGWIC